MTHAMRAGLALLVLLSTNADAFAPCGRTGTSIGLSSERNVPVGSKLFTYYDESSPSDYDEDDLVSAKGVEVDMDEGDDIIRDELKRELLLLSSVSNRGEFASLDDQNVITDLVAQLEALNPTEDPAMKCEGEWDLALSSTQFFRSSPFFLTIRAAMGASNKAMAENAFDIHDRATTAGRIGRVRQTIVGDTLTSEVDLEVGVFPGLPFRVKGSVITRASFRPVSSETAELQVGATEVKGSNIPILNQYLDNLKLELPVNQIFERIQGSVPTVELKTYYIDEGMRITRDMDDNFFVYTRA
uniref:Plastid lipid-associated protein/fibrillin conserved domain-containing protein n=1 Tax=Entomoneis paludosa TaxID=265537 RepID=A0A7S2Y236_9STRA